MCASGPQASRDPEAIVSEAPSVFLRFLDGFRQLTDRCAVHANTSDIPSGPRDGVAGLPPSPPALMHSPESRVSGLVEPQ